MTEKMMIVLVMVISLLVGLAKTNTYSSDTTGVDLSERGDGVSGSGSTSVAPPMIVIQPMNITANVLQNVTFSLKAVGYNVTYQWRHINSDYIIGTQSNLTILGVNPSDEGQYYCIAFNKGGQIPSDLVTLTVNRLIILHQQSATIASGRNITFSMINTKQNCTYHWKKKNGLLPSNAVGQNTPHLSIISATSADSGLYHCIVRFLSSYNVPTTRIKLTVHGAPTILSDYATHDSEKEEVVILICKVKGNHLKGGYWERIDKGPSPKECNTSSSYLDDDHNTVLLLKIDRTFPNCSGQYHCVAFNDWGITVSGTHHVTISVLGPITIVRQPQSTTAATGSNVTISITAQGYGLKYLWKKHYGLLSSNIVGQYSPYLNITSVTHNDDGEYYCVVKDHWGHTVKSQKAMLAVLALPVITTHPNNNGPITVAEGSDVVLRCEATGEGTLNYQWRRLSGSLPDNVQGNNTTNLTITNITVSDGGEYYCVVDNGGTSVFSMKVQLSAKVEPTIKSYSQNQHVTIDSGSENLILIWEFGGDDIDNITCQKQNRGVAVTINDDFSIRTDHTYKLLLNNVRPVDSGEYSCGVFSRWGVAQSSKIKVNITIPPPNIIIQPISRRIAVLDNVTLICKAEGFEVTYKWRHNGTTANANTSQSGLAITQVVPSDAGHYVCIASTEGGKDVSQRATLTIKGLQLTPSNLTVGKGSNVHLNCCINSSEVFWHIEKQGVTNTTVSYPLMKLYNVSEEESIHIRCSLNVRGENITSNQATLTVFGLAEQLNDTIAPVGSEVVLRCSASVSTAVNCNWKHNNTEIKDWHHSSLMLSNISLADEGSYTCEMKGNAGKAVASTAKLKILDVSIHLSNHTVTVGSSVNLTCSASLSSSILTYQWLHNDTIMKHEIGAVLTITNMQIADIGSYQCMVTVNTNTSKMSDIILLSTADMYISYDISSSNHTSTNQNTELFFIGGGVVLVIIIGIIFSVILLCWCCRWCCRKSKGTLNVPTHVDIPLPEIDLPDAPESSTNINVGRPEELLGDGSHKTIEPDQVGERSSATSSDKNVTYEVSITSDTSIMTVLNSMQPKLLGLIVMSQLLPYLVKYDVLTVQETQKLQLKNETDFDKAQYLLSTILCSKGPEGEKNFVKALYEISKERGNFGYTDVIFKLQREGILVSEASNDSTNVLAVRCADDNQSITSTMITSINIISDAPTT